MRPDVVGDAGGLAGGVNKTAFDIWVQGTTPGTRPGTVVSMEDWRRRRIGLDVSTLLQLDTRPSQVVADDKPAHTLNFTSKFISIEMITQC